MKREIDYYNILDTLVGATRDFAEFFIEDCCNARIDYDYAKDTVEICKDFINLCRQYDIIMCDSYSSWEELEQIEDELWEMIPKVLKAIWKNQP